ncbi:hypothetical protein KAU11_07305 [Candidatus Babeliales bacterium]|nr:hypothetical protein [Candidatus Babeliales bacterium]
MGFDFKRGNSEADIKYANWNSGYEDIFNQIIEIREMGNLLLFDTQNENLLLNKYYSKISGLFITHGHYVIQQEGIKLQLDKIESILFSNKYLNSVKDKTNTRDQHLKILKDLKIFFQLICESFSKNGLTMKIIIKRRKASERKGLTPDEVEELEALEEVGIM